MAVKSNFSNDDFVSILSNYDLGDFEAAQPLTNGTVQTNFLLQTGSGKYVFRYYENRPLGSVLFESNLINYLTAKRYPCPAAFSNRDGEFVGLFAEKPYIIFEYVDGEHLETLSDDQKSQLIHHVAELHNITQTYEPSYQEHRWNYDVDLCRTLAQEAAAKQASRNARYKLAWFEAELSALDLPDTLPKGICHCDFHPSNVLFQNGVFKALLDFDDANYTFLSFDLASLMNPFVPGFDWNSWFHFRPDENVFDFTEAKSVAQAYMRHRPLTADEKTHLFDMFKLTVMFDCVWYFARGAAHDFFEKRKIDYLNQLGRSRFYHEIFD
ncbi:MAG: homoserine kinase [Anaerolineaceae bacterium]|nr:homoserine kinase [Anaerolineaceae bacterium]